MKTILLCGQLFTAEDERIQQNMAVLVCEQGIEAIAPIDAATAWEGERIDLTRSFVMPGLIDAHIHGCASGGNELTDLHKLIGTCVFDMLENVRADMLAGFTTLRDEGAYHFVDVSVRNAIAAGRAVGPRLLVSGLPIGATGGHADEHYAPPFDAVTASLIVDSPDAARRAARHNVKYGVDQLKLMATGGVMSLGSEPGAQELTFDEMRAVIEVAEMQGKLTSAHAHGAAGIKTAIRAGITSIEHGMMLDEECIELFVKHGTYLIPTIIAGHQIVVEGPAMKLNPATVEKSRRCLEHHAINLQKCRKAGVKIGFGTDAGTPANMHGKQALEFQLMTEVGFTPMETLLAATRVNARMIRREQSIGTLAPGKLADIIALPESPLQDITALARVQFVMVGGAVVRA